MEKVINIYETLFIVDVTAGEEVAKASVEKFAAVIAGAGEIVEKAEWGRRRLAYPIDDMNEGYYAVIRFKADAEFPAELDRLFNIDESVMRSTIIKLDPKTLEKAAAKAAADKAAAEKAAAEKEAAEAAAATAAEEVTVVAEEVTETAAE